MCVAVIINPGSPVPPLDDLLAMEAANADGGGVGWSEGPLCYYRKALKAPEVHALILELRERGVASCILVHFRIATVGGPLPELCHPFQITAGAECPLSGSAKKIMIHNGHWSDWSQYMKIIGRRFNHPSVTWSDTRAAARLLALNFIEPKDLGGKVAVMDGKGVTYYGDWTEENGCLYSNVYWKYRPKKKATSKIHEDEWRKYFGGRSFGDIGTSYINRQQKERELNAAFEKKVDAMITPQVVDIPPLFTAEELAGTESCIHNEQEACASCYLTAEQERHQWLQGVTDS